MNIKKIKFEGGELLGVQTDDGKIYMGVNKFLEEIGFKDKENQKYQRRKLLEDETIKRGVTTLTLLSNGGEQETICIHLDIIPTAMVKFNPNDLHKKSKSLTDIQKEIYRNKLMNYQSKASIVLANEFLGDTENAKEFQQDFNFVDRVMNDLEEVKSQNIEMKTEVMDLRDKVSRLIDSSTINYRQAQKLLHACKDRISEMLGGAHSEKYKKFSRMYFKNLWLNFGESFEVSSYKDLNPTQMDNAYTFIKRWSMV